MPLSKTHYTLVYANDPQLTATDRITLRYRHAGIMEQDHLVMAIRALGSESPFEHFVEAQTVETAKQSFLSRSVVEPCFRSDVLCLS